jgi:hypothetical protein
MLHENFFCGAAKNRGIRLFGTFFVMLDVVFHVRFASVRRFEEAGRAKP